MPPLRRKSNDTHVMVERLNLLTDLASEGMWHFRFTPPIDTSLDEDAQVNSFFYDSRLVYCNSAYASMYDETPESLLGRPLSYLVERNEHNTKTLREFIQHDYKMDRAESHERDRHARLHRFSNNLVALRDSAKHITDWYGTQRELFDSSIPPNEILGEPQRKKPWPRLFVLMPFKEALKPVYQNHIKAVAKRCKLSVKRADDFNGNGIIMKDIWSAINFSEVIVADCTGRNPNVFYEIGLAHTIGKPTILIAQSMKDIPFDLGAIRIIIYKPLGMRDFEARLSATLKELGVCGGNQKE